MVLQRGNGGEMRAGLLRKRHGRGRIEDLRFLLFELSEFREIIDRERVCIWYDYCSQLCVKWI